VFSSVLQFGKEKEKREERYVDVQYEEK